MIGRERYQHVPYPLGTPEWESFKNYVVAYYKEALKIASRVSKEIIAADLGVKGFGEGDFGRGVIFGQIINVTLSPLVFLWEKWQLMTSEAKLPYATPEYKLTLEENIKKAKEITEKAHR